MTYKEATARAIAAGASPVDIACETAHQRKHAGSVPQRNMIKALQLLPWHNTCDDWTRLAGAVGARRKP